VKTQIIQLEPHDDFVSVKDKMSWSQIPRILLVWPEEGPPLLDRQLDLALLKRHADQLGAQLALVTRSPNPRYFARQLDLPVFRSTLDAQNTRWLKRRRARGPETRHDPSRISEIISGRHKAMQKPAPAGMRLAALLAGLASILALAGVLVPSAKITLIPATDIQSIEFTAITGPDITALNASGTIPARPLSITLEGRTSVETTGSLEVPGEAATGQILVTNLTAEAVTIPKGTVVLSGGADSVRFATTRSAQLPATAGATVEIPIAAVQPGPTGNLPIAAITSVEGTLGLQITVTNPEPTAGGTTVAVKAPNTLDRSRVYADLLASLRATAAEEIAAQLAPGDLLLSATPFLAATLEETYMPAEAAPSDLLDLTLRVEFQSLVIARLDLDALGRAVLDASLPPGFTPSGDQIDVTLLTLPEPNALGAAQWQVRAERPVQAVADGASLIPAILGRAPGEARSTLNTALLLGAPPEISLSPSWWPWLPLLPIQIQLIETQ